MLLEDYLALMVTGVTMGAVYAMVGVGLNIAYKPTNVFNLAQGEFVMLGAMFAWGLMTDLSWPWLVAAPLVLLAVAVFGAFEERIAVAPLLKSASHHHGWIISTLAFSIVIVNVSDQVYGTDPRAVPPIPGASLQNMQIGPLPFTTQQFAIVLMAVLSIAAVEYFYRHTLMGKRVLAVAEDPDAARLNGISPLKLTMASFAAGAAYCAFAGIIAAPILLASTSIGLLLLVKGFMALAIGGVGNNWGTLLGGLMIGCVESISSVSATPGYRQVLLLAVLLVILLIRPYGFFGSRAVRDV